MSIAGKAMKMDDIVKFISLLQARPDIANVQLISADESNNNNSSTAGVIDLLWKFREVGWRSEIRNAWQQYVRKQ